jgi:hypothetical protein
MGKNCYPVPTTSDGSFEPCGVQGQVQLRDSRQPERSSVLRSIANSAKKRPIVGLGERVYESTTLAALFDVLVDRGCPAGEILRNVNLTVDEVHCPKSRISLAELMTACKNAIRLSSDPQRSASLPDDTSGGSIAVARAP